MWLVYPEYYSWIKKTFFNIYYRSLDKDISFIAISNHIKNSFKKKFKFSKIKVIYNPIIIKSKFKFKKKLIFENKKFFFYLIIMKNIRM